MIALNALATRAGGPAVRITEVATRAPRIWSTDILLVCNSDAGIRVEAAPNRVVRGWPAPLSRTPAVPRRVLEAPVLRWLLRRRPVTAILHYGTYVPLRRVPGVLNVLCFGSLAPWDPGPDSGSARNRMLRWLFERTHRHADLIVVQSAATQKFLQRCYPETSSRLALVRNGVCLPALRRPRRRSGFLLLGDIYAYRRIADVVRAYAQLDAEIRAVHPLIIAGSARRDRNATEDVLRAIRASQLDNVRLAGLLPRPEALEAMASACAFVSFASVENGPNALAEACAMGTPTIVSDIPVHREYAGPQSSFVRDTDELLRALQAAAAGAGNDMPGNTPAVDTWEEHVAALGRLLAAAGAIPGGELGVARAPAPPTPGVPAAGHHAGRTA